MSARNREGLTWAEWHAAATLEDNVCCSNAHNQCNYGACPRLIAWRNGEDPSDWRAEAERQRNATRMVSLDASIKE